MTYLQLINRFWETDRAAPFTPCETRLYMLLLDTSSRNGWGCVTFAKEELAALAGVAPATFLRARAHLSEAGLISYSKGIGGRRQKTSYLISEAPRKGTTIKPFSEKKGIKKGVKNDTLFPERVSKTIPFTPIDIDSSYRESNINISLSNKRECEREGAKEFFDACRCYFLSPERREFQEAQERLYGIVDLSEAFEKFYDIIVSEDLLKQVQTRQDFARLFKYKYCIPNQRINETKRQDRFSERRGTDPSTLRPEDYTDTL